MTIENVDPLSNSPVNMVKDKAVYLALQELYQQTADIADKLNQVIDKINTL